MDLLVIPNNKNFHVIKIMDTETVKTTALTNSSRKGVSEEPTQPCQLKTIHPSLVTWAVELANNISGEGKSGPAFASCRNNGTCIEFTLNRNYASYCYCVGREHINHRITIAIVICDGRAFQSCWDRTCNGCVVTGVTYHTCNHSQ